MSKTEKTFLVRRNCTRKSGNVDEQGSHALESYRNLPAYVLLGDPGAGKTVAFKREAEESDGKYIKARDFAAFEMAAEYRGKTLFIDALDEMRADGGDGWTAIVQVSRRLEELGCVRFRLSCREADWLGESDNETLKRISPNVVALYLDPLTDNDIIEILRHKCVPDPDDFVRNADEHRLGDLLRNPQILNLLVKAIGGDERPQSRKDIYEMACRQLVREESRAHRNAKREMHHSPDVLLDAAGYLCAIHLLSGIAGFALDEDAGDKYHYNWNELTAYGLPLLPALKTNLFQKDGEEQRIPVHRSVAEYLGARYLAEQVEKQGLPFGRILALITGEDGGMVPDLRGLAAWLSMHCLSGRRVLIERDPLGVVLYGDVRNFITEDKLLVLNALKNEAQRYPWFRSQDWTASPFGALGTADMEPAFREILSSPSRTEADQALLYCVLDAIRHGEPMSALAAPLEEIIRDASFSPDVRACATEALIHVISGDRLRLLKLAQDIHTGAIEDQRDEILSDLLRELYPRSISPEQIFDYLHPTGNINVSFMFWSYELPALATKEELSVLLDQLVRRHIALGKATHDFRINQMAGELLVRGLEEHGDVIANEQLYNWLGIGFDENDDLMLDSKYAESIARWFANHPDRYKAMIEYGASLCTGGEVHRLSQGTLRLYDAPPPADIGIWYLEKAATERQSALAQQYFHQAVYLLILEGGQNYLTHPALEFLESWVSAYPAFQPWLEWFITCEIGEWRQKNSIKNRKRDIEQKKRKSEWMDFYRQHIEAIRNGSAHPQILHNLAQAYRGLIYEAKGKTPRGHLEDLLDGDKELVEAAYSGFRNALNRDDLPTISEIVELELKGKMHYLHLACLVGMDELYQINPPEALQLDDAVLSRLLAFQLLHGGGGDDPAWFTKLIDKRPALVAEVLLAYALPMLRAGKEHVDGLSLLAYNDAYSEVARIALTALLEGFPLRARKPQLKFALDPLLKGALHYLDKETFASTIQRKLELGSMDGAQKVHWLACGLIIDPPAYAEKLFRHIGKSKPRRSQLASFLHGRWEREFPYAALPESALALLIELLVPGCSPERPEGPHWVSPAMQTADLMRAFINKLGGNPSETTTLELERLLALPSLAHWHNHLRHALHDQRIARRKATFRRLSVEEVSRTLANLQPASAADLAALTFDHLRDIARKIRDGSTNDYKQYWKYGEESRNLDKPRLENDCRDTLLFVLQERLGKHSVDAQREGNYADHKRADIRVSFGGTNGFNVPIEIKKDTHDDLWRAIHEQLIPKYIRDPGADGYGIYLVFWFGGKGMKPPFDGKKLRSAAELEDRLRQTLTPEEGHRIQICVIDCALPS